MTPKADPEDTRWQLSTAHILSEIRAERDRQRVGEGFSRSHDDNHRAGVLARAGAAYAFVGSLDAHVRDKLLTDKGIGTHERQALVDLFPWPIGLFKMKDTARRCLIIAAAFIVAEIEKIDRARERSEGRD